MTIEQIKAINDAMSVISIADTAESADTLLIAKGTALEQMRQADIDSLIMEHFVSLIDCEISKYY